MKAQQPLDDNPCRPRHFKPAPCAPLPMEGPAKQSLETSHTRLIVTAGLFLLAFLAIGIRLVDVTVLKGGETKLARTARTVTQPQVSRADIVDRNGVLLATTLETPSLFANPKQVANPQEAARKIVSVLPDLSEGEVLAKLTSDKSFVWLKRRLTPRQQFDVNRLGIPGLQFEREERRVYPKGNLAAHVVGYTGIDNKGLAGVERGLDDALHERRDPIKLSIDIRLQYILRDEVQKQIDDFRAKGGMGLIADVRTGEILSMISLPDFDPNNAGAASPEAIFNRATLGVFEMGSIFKIFNTAMALDTKTATMTSGYDATKAIPIGKYTIHDDHPQRRWLTVPEIFQYSSNIGSVKMALDAGIEKQRDVLTRLGLTRMPTLELKEIGGPLIPSPWRQINSMTIAFGHGMSVSPLQMINATSAVVNGGILHQATLLKHPDDYIPAGEKVLSQPTSENMRKLMRLVVEKGTGEFANAPGYLIGGKTGTAEKVTGKSYARKAVLASFVGVFPMNDPRYVVMISIDEPHGNAKSHGFITAGWVAAPPVGRVVQRMAPLLGIQPVDENSPEIRRALVIDSSGQQGRKVAAN